MKRFSSLEDLVSDVAIVATNAPALSPEDTRGVVSAQQNARVLLRAEVANDNIAAAQAAADDLEDIRQTVEESAVDGRIGLESFVMAQLAMRANPVLRDMQLTNFGPALEDFTGDDQVTVSVEGLSDTVKAFGAAVGKLLIRFAEEFSRSLAFTATRTVVAQRGLRKMQEWANRHRGATASTEEILLDGGVLLQGDNAPKQPVRALVDLAGTMDYMVSKFQPEMINAIRANSRNIGLINDSSDESFRKTFDAAVKQWKFPSANPAQLNSTLLGGYELFSDQKPGYHGNDPTLAKLDAIATKSQMNTLAYMGGEASPELGRQEFRALSPDEVVAITAAHLKTLAKVKKMESAMVSLASGMRTGTSIVAHLAGAPLFLAVYSNALVLAIRSLPLAVYPGGRQYKEQARFLRRALRAQERQLRYATFDAVQLELLYVRHILRYCRASMKAGHFR